MYDAEKQPVAGYVATDKDESGDPTYYGFTAFNGHWYILQVNAAAGAFRYANGTGSYTTSWTGRAGLVYDYFYKLSWL